MINLFVEIAATLTDVIFLVWFVSRFHDIPISKNFGSLVWAVLLFSYQIFIDTVLPAFNMVALIGALLFSVCFSLSLERKAYIRSIFAAFLYLIVIMLTGNVIYSIFSLVIEDIGAVIHGSRSYLRVIYLLICKFVHLAFYQLILKVLGKDKTLNWKNGVLSFVFTIATASALGFLMKLAIENPNHQIEVIVLFLAVLLVLSLSSAICMADGFVFSPSQKGAPELVSAENVSEDCEADLFITAYADRDSLPDEVVEKFEYAYDVVLGKKEDIGFKELLARVAAERGIDVNDLAVSDFFDISCSDCQGHDNHSEFDIVLKASALENFVCLLHYYNGTWTVVDNAEVTQNGEHLEFKEEEFSPFLIVVNTGSTSVDPSDDTSSRGIWLAVLVVALLAGGYGIYHITKSKKGKVGV